jgi:hypothetical protein
MQQGRRLAARMSATIEWLARDECHALVEAGLAAELGRRLRAAGLPLDHLGLYLRTLHPEILSQVLVQIESRPQPASKWGRFTRPPAPHSRQRA